MASGKESILEKKKMRPGTKIHEDLLEEEEQRSINRQQRHTAGWEANVKRDAVFFIHEWDRFKGQN